MFCAAGVILMGVGAYVQVGAFVSLVQITIMNYVLCTAGVILMGVGAYVSVHELCFVQPALF
jgi:hypothetical protein